MPSANPPFPIHNPSGKLNACKSESPSGFFRPVQVQGVLRE
jgi:hypothetical protein